MLEGNIVVSAVAVDEHDLVSSVARKNYIVNPQKSYTYTEALEILKDRMKELGMLNADEQTAPNGAAAVFSYVGNVTINDTELYEIRVDLKSGTQTTTEGNYGVGIKKWKMLPDYRNRRRISGIFLLKRQQCRDLLCYKRVFLYTRNIN